MIRRAESSDAAALADLLTQLGYTTTSAEMTVRWQTIDAAKHFATFVALDGDAVCGMIGLSSLPSYTHNERVGRIVVMVVSQAWRGRGIGKGLVDAAEEYFRGEGIARMRLTTRTERSAAHVSTKGWASPKRACDSKRHSESASA